MAGSRILRYLRRLAGRQAGLHGQVAAIGGHHQLFVHSGRVLMLLGAIILVQRLSTSSPGSSDDDAEAEKALLGFLLWLLGAALAMLSLGAALAMLSLVARQFRGLAAAVAAVVAALRDYLLGGL